MPHHPHISKKESKPVPVSCQHTCLLTSSNANGLRNEFSLPTESYRNSSAPSSQLFRLIPPPHPQKSTETQTRLHLSCLTDTGVTTAKPNTEHTELPEAFISAEQERRIEQEIKRC